jgi:hypothetical protein
MNLLKYIFPLMLFLPVFQGNAQEIRSEEQEGDGWDRTRMILDCAPILVDQRGLVEDNFDHRYVTNNPRDIEVGYFSVEPITYLEEGRRFCEALLPVSGVSHSYFRGCYLTSYQLPGDGEYKVKISSSALVFNNELRIINAQSTVASVKATHRLEIELDTTLNPTFPDEATLKSNPAYEWELEIGPSGVWHGEVLPGDMEMTDTKIPAGFSNLELEKTIRGPGTVTIRESVIFRVHSVSAYKYDPIFQAACLFSLEPLGISTRLLPCGDQ